MYESFLLKLDQEVNGLKKKNYRNSPRFIGEDMYPQFNTCGSWRTQVFDNRVYFKSGDLWLSQDIFRIFTDSTTGIFSISKMFYIESITVSSSCRLRIADTTLDIDNKNDYHIIVYPYDDYELEKDVYIEFMMRELL